MKKRILLLSIICLIIFLLPLNVKADTIKYKWYKEIEKNINYEKQNECNTLINKKDYKEKILYQKETDTKEYINNDEVFFKKGSLEKKLDTEYIEYVGFKNAQSIKNYLVINHINLYNKNTGEEIMFNYYNSGNLHPDSESVFISSKYYLAFLNDGYAFLVLHNKTKASDLKITIDTDNPKEIKNITLFATSDKNNITYTKNLNNSINNISTHTLDEFNKTSSYFVESFIYYEKLYKCYEEEKEYKDGYYEYLDGYIKDEKDYIVEKEEIKESNNLKNINNNPFIIEKENYVNPLMLYDTNNYAYEEEPVEEVKTISNKKESISKKQTNKKIKKKSNNINILYLIITIIVITIIFLTIYFIKKCRTK